MQLFCFEEVMQTTLSFLPLTLLLIDSDQERQQLTEAYLKYRALMYKTAIGYFPSNWSEVEDAISTAVERMCRYSQNFFATPCHKRASYVVRLVENVCRTRLRKMALEKNRYAFSLNEQDVPEVSEAEDVEEVVLCHLLAEDLMKTFELLSRREQEIIRMRHLDHMTFSDMAQELMMSEDAIRAALSRAKRRWKQLAQSRE